MVGVTPSKPELLEPTCTRLVRNVCQRKRSDQWAPETGSRWKRGTALLDACPEDTCISTNAWAYMLRRATEDDVRTLPVVLNGRGVRGRTLNSARPFASFIAPAFGWWVSEGGQEECLLP